MQTYTYLGKGLREPCAPYRQATVYGADLNTPNASGWNCPPEIVDPVSVLSLAGLAKDHEAVVCLVNLFDIREQTRVTSAWYHKGELVPFYIFATLVPDPKTQNRDFWEWYYIYSGVGYLDKEINANGDYFVQTQVGPTLYTMSFNVTGIGTEPDWPLLLKPIKDFLDKIWSGIVDYFNQVVTWVYDRLKPLFDTIFAWLESAKQWIVDNIAPLFTSVFSWITDAVTSIGEQVSHQFLVVWDWIQASVSSIVGQIASQFSQVYSWIDTAFRAVASSVAGYFGTLMTSIAQLSTFVATKIDSINKWFSDEFIDPVIDWLLQFPGKLTEALSLMISNLGNRLESWLTHRSPGFPGIIGEWYRQLNEWVMRNLGFFTPGSPVYQGETAGIWALIGMGVAAMFSQVVSVIGPVLSSLGSTIGGWLGELVPRALGWLTIHSLNIGIALRAIPGRMAGWFLANSIPLLGAGGVLTLEATGQLEKIIHNYVTPAIVGVFDWFEARGPVAPIAGRDISDGITKLAEFTVSGLAGLTLAGEALSPLKHMGMGHLAAIIYDLVNYKTLTAAFMGVLAVIYIKTPLTYYYNRVARPNIPDERQLGDLRREYVISSREYAEGMQFMGYPDSWIAQLEQVVNRPMTPYMLRSLAEAGLLDDRLLDHALRQAGYDEISIPYIKRMMQNLASSSQAALSTSTAMTRYQEGFDDEATLRANLTALGVADTMLDRYVFAAQLKYLYDYQTDLKNFYIDQYHRREIEEPELRTNLVSAGINPDRIDVYVQAQAIKRLKAPAAADDPALTLQVDTVRDRRKKRLITRDQEIQSLVAMGKELGYALAVADNDDVTLAEPGPAPTPTPLPSYETEAGKVEVDTIRRIRRSGQSTSDEELAALKSLGMPASLAQAIVDNDTLRVKKSATTGE